MAGNAALAAASQSQLVGLYPASGKLRTWTIAESVGLALATLEGLCDPLPEWVRAGADVAELGHLLKGKEVRPLPLSFTFGSPPRSEYGKGCRDSLL